MFTGIIQDVGRVHSFEHQGSQSLFVFETSLDMQRWQPGDSVAVDGCCLTITSFPDDKKSLWSATLSSETLSLTRFSGLDKGSPVNLEPALRVGDALGGHMVSGHVDGLATVTNITKIDEHRKITFKVPESLKHYIVHKGSVTLNGVSLTVNEVDGSFFAVNLIPHTLEHTNLSELEVDSVVNLETDLLGRYVERMMSCRETDA